MEIHDNPKTCTEHITNNTILSYKSNWGGVAHRANSVANINTFENATLFDTSEIWNLGHFATNCDIIHNLVTLNDTFEQSGVLCDTLRHLSALIDTLRHF